MATVKWYVISGGLIGGIVGLVGGKGAPPIGAIGAILGAVASIPLAGIEGLLVSLAVLIRAHTGNSIGYQALSVLTPTAVSEAGALLILGCCLLCIKAKEEDAKLAQEREPLLRPATNSELPFYDTIQTQPQLEDTSGAAPRSRTGSDATDKTAGIDLSPV